MRQRVEFHYYAVYFPVVVVASTLGICEMLLHLGEVGAQLPLVIDGQTSLPQIFQHFAVAGEIGGAFVFAEGVAPPS